MAAVCLLKPDDMETVRDFLHEFCAAWKPLYLRGRGRDFRGWTGNSETAYQHTIRCFSNATSTDKAGFVPYVQCARETGQFPSLSGTLASSFVERRMSVLCRWSYSDDPGSFTVVVLGDFQSVRSEARDSNDLFTDWEGRRFTVRGKNAGYHVLQSALHRMLMYWEKEWTSCLDALENSVNTKVGWRDRVSSEDPVLTSANNSLMISWAVKPATI